MADILALVPYLPGTAGGQRTTIECWAPLLAQDGIRLRLAPFQSEALHADLYTSTATATKIAELARGFAERLHLMADLGGYDAVFVYREAALIGPEILERWVARKGLPIIYGLDDPLFVPYRSPANGMLSRLKFPGKVARLCEVASAVIVNGSPLRNFASEHNSNVWVVPNLVDESTYRPEAGRAGDPPRLGWIGSHSSVVNLDVLAEPLNRLAARVPFELEVIGAERQMVGTVPCTVKPWSEATEVSDLRSFDVGLLPLVDHAWNPWKFNFKLAQYMALGIPPVCTPAGSNPEIIDHGVNGFLASSADEWVECLEALIRDEDLRQSIGSAAADYARRHFTLSANRDAIIGAFRSVLDRRAVTTP